MINGIKVIRPTKAAIVNDIARMRGIPNPHVSDGSSVDSQFLDAIHTSLMGTPTRGADAYRKAELLLDCLGLTYDPYWDTSESAPTGGSTVTTRAYSRIRSALGGIPRCFILNVTDAPVGTRWERNHEEVYRYDDTVTGRGSLNDAGPGSRIVYYATSKSKTNKKCFIAAAEVDYIAPGWRGPWEARLKNYREFETPLSVDDVALPGWNRQHSLTEISFATYEAILAAGGLDAPKAETAGTTTGEEGMPIDDPDPGGADVAERILKDFPTAEANPTIEVPDALPMGILTGGEPAVPSYTETLSGVTVDDPGLMPPKSKDPRRDKLAEQRSVDLTIKALKSAGWSYVRDCQMLGVGYDLEFQKQHRNLHVEVKGIQGSQLAFNVTPKEFWRAETDAEWVLVAVTSVLSPAAYKLHVITRDVVVAATRVITGFRVTL